MSAPERLRLYTEEGDFCGRIDGQEYVRADLMPKWQPIETAPKDGTVILLYRPNAYDWGKVTPGRWESQKHNKKPNPFWEIWFRVGGTAESRMWKPTHWMPLPEPPKE